MSLLRIRKSLTQAFYRQTKEDKKKNTLTPTTKAVKQKTMPPFPTYAGNMDVPADFNTALASSRFQNSNHPSTVTSESQQTEILSQQYENISQ
jgi:hypothetical protein